MWASRGGPPASPVVENMPEPPHCPVASAHPVLPRHPGRGAQGSAEGERKAMSRCRPCHRSPVAVGQAPPAGLRPHAKSVAWPGASLRPLPVSPWLSSRDARTYAAPTWMCARTHTHAHMHMHKACVFSASEPQAHSQPACAPRPPGGQQQCLQTSSATPRWGDAAVFSWVGVGDTPKHPRPQAAPTTESL